MICALAGFVMAALAGWRLVHLARVADRNIEEMRLLRDARAERRVEWMLREGFSVRRIARELRLSAHTVCTVKRWMETREAKARG